MCWARFDVKKNMGSADRDERPFAPVSSYSHVTSANKDGSAAAHDAAPPGFVSIFPAPHSPVRAHVTLQRGRRPTSMEGIGLELLARCLPPVRRIGRFRQDENHKHGGGELAQALLAWRSMLCRRIFIPCSRRQRSAEAPHVSSSLRHAKPALSDAPLAVQDGLCDLRPLPAKVTASHNGGPPLTAGIFGCRSELKSGIKLPSFQPFVVWGLPGCGEDCLIASGPATPEFSHGRSGIPTMYGPAPPRPKRTQIVRARTGCKGCRKRRTKVGRKPRQRNRGLLQLIMESSAMSKNLRVAPVRGLGDPASQSRQSFDSTT